jgi:hypothetical protein
MAQLTIDLTEAEFDQLAEVATAAGEPAPELAARLVRASLEAMRRPHANDEAVRKVLAASFRDREEVYRRLAQ